MNNLELVAFAKSKLGTPYVYGTKGEVLTEEKYDRLKLLYGKLVWDSDRKKIGKVCVDCSGLISWATGIFRNSQGYHDTATEVFPISTIEKAPVGAAVWCKGHIGLYLGDGKYIAADGSAHGVRIANVRGNVFTHWFLLKDVTYEEEEEMVRYKYLKEVPASFRPIIEKLMDAKIIGGDGSDPNGNNDVIDLSHDMVRQLVFEYRGGAFDKKLIAEGFEPAVK